MSTVLMGALLFGIAGGCAFLFQKRIEVFFACAVCAMILILYFFGLFGWLTGGIYFILLAGLIGLGWMIYSCGKARSVKPLRLIVTPGAVCFALLMAAVFVFYRGRMFVELDEFSHWGSVIKNMCLSDQIPQGKAFATFGYTDYPPATALFSYLWIKLSGAYNEGDAYRAQVILTLSMFMPLYRHISWKRWYKAIPLSMACVMLPLAFNSFTYRFLLVDSLLGVVGAYIAASYMTGERDGAAMLNTCCGLMVLTLIKKSGVAIAVLLLLAMVADTLGKDRELAPRKRWTKIGMLVFSVLLAEVSWKVYLASQGIQNSWPVDTPRILAFLSGNWLPYQTDTIKRYAWLMEDQNGLMGGYLFQMSYWLALVVFVALGVLIIHKQKTMEVKRRTRRAVGILAVGAVLYALFLLITYLFTFSEAESMVAASHERYLSTYLFVMYGFLLYAAITAFGEEQKSHWGVYGVVALCILLYVNPNQLYPSTILAGEENAEICKFRAANDIRADALELLNNGTDKLYVVTQNTEVYQIHFDLYLLTTVPRDGAGRTMDRRFCREQWPVEGPAEAERQAFADELRKKLTLEGSSYLYLRQVEDSFAEQYGFLFAEPESIDNDSLFRVTDDGVPLFQCVTE